MQKSSLQCSGAQIEISIPVLKSVAEHLEMQTTYIYSHDELSELDMTSKWIFEKIIFQQKSSKETLEKLG